MLLALLADVEDDWCRSLDQNEWVELTWLLCPTILCSVFIVRVVVE